MRKLPLSITGFLFLTLAPVAGAQQKEAQALEAETKALREKLSEAESQKASLQKSLEEQKKGLEDAKKGLEDAKKGLEDAKKNAANEAKTRASAAAKEALSSFKYLEVAFGVLPNSDAAVNNVGRLGVNYTESLSTGLVYNSRNANATAERSSTSAGPSGTKIKEIKSSDKGTLDSAEVNYTLHLIAWQPKSLELAGGMLSPMASLGVDQRKETRARTISGTQSFVDPIGNRERVIVSSSTIDEKSTSTMPNLALGFRLGGVTGLSLTAGGTFFVGNRETYSWRERGSAFFPPFSTNANDLDEESKAQLARSDESRTNKFISKGYRLKADLGYEGESHGFGIHFESERVAGDRTAYNVKTEPVEPKFEDPAYPGRITNEGEQSRTIVDEKVEETRSRTVLGVTWGMNFLRSWGVVPVVTFDVIDAETKTKGPSGESADKTNQFDLGVIFKY